MAELAKDKIASRQEIIIPITVRGIYKALRLISFDKPRDLTSVLAEKSERLSQRMMTGHFAVLS